MELLPRLGGFQAGRGRSLHDGNRSLGHLTLTTGRSELGVQGGVSTNRGGRLDRWAHSQSSGWSSVNSGTKGGAEGCRASGIYAQI